MKEGLYIHIEDALAVFEKHCDGKGILEELKEAATVYMTKETVVRKK